MNSRSSQRGPLLILTVLFALNAGSLILAEGDDYTVSEMEQRRQISHQAQQLLRERKFAELESLAEDYRTNKTRLPSGLWKLYNFYEGLERPGYNASGQEWVAHFDLLNEWRTARPKSPTARTALASAYASYAWEARGSGYANTVTEEGWRLFKQRLKQAEDIIREAEGESLYDPHLASVHLQVGKGSSWPEREYRQVFEAAIKREPCYPPYYFQRINWLMPRWSGNPGDSERFAQQAISLNEGCEGKGLYSRLAVYLLMYKGHDSWFFDVFKFDWPTVRDGFDELEKQYPHSSWNLNYYCLFACEAQDDKTAHRLFQRIGDRWESSVWNNEGVYRKWENWAANPSAHPLERGDSSAHPVLWKKLLRIWVLMSWFAAVVLVSVFYWSRAKRRGPPPLPPLPPP